MFVAKAVLVAITVICLLSMGGAMRYAWPVLLPLHWLAAMRSGPYAAGGWALLAGLSVWQAGWMTSYVVVGSHPISLLLGFLLAVGTMAGMLQVAARLHVGRTTPAHGS